MCPAAKSSDPITKDSSSPVFVGINSSARSGRLNLGRSTYFSNNENIGIAIEKTEIAMLNNTSQK